MKNIALFVAMLATLFAASSLQAQDRTQRREFIQGLLQGLLESQLDRGNDPRRDVLPGQFPNYPGQPNVRPAPRPRPPVTVEVTPEMRKVRRKLSAWNRSSNDLVTQLRKHEVSAPQVRGLLAESLQFQALVNAVDQRAQLLPTVQPLTNDFLSLDRQWRTLSTRLRQTRGLPRQCTRTIDSMSGVGTELCGLFQVQPQINRVELSRLASTLSNDYDHLLRGVYYSARGKRGGDALLRQGQSLQASIQQASSLINRGDYDTIVAAYQTCNAEWKTFSRQVLRLQDERLRYSVQHIEDTGRRIQEQLWIPFQLDREYLASLTEAINVDVQQVFGSVSMAELMATPQPGNLLSLCREFQQTCTNFNRQLQNNTPEDQLEWSYRLFASKWDRLHEAMHCFENPRVDHRLEDIEFSMNALAEVFGDEIIFGHDDLCQLYSELDALCKQASFDIHRRITAQRYPPEFHDQMCGLGDSLSRTVSNLHRAAVRPNYRPSPDQLQPMFDSWIALRPMLAKCQAEDRTHFANFRRQLEPLIVKLQVAYSN